MNHYHIYELSFEETLLRMEITKLAVIFQEATDHLLS